MSFDIVEGGVLCRHCRRGRAVSADALELLRAMLDGRLKSVLSEPAGPLVTEVTELMTEAMESHLDRYLRSVRAAPGLWSTGIPPAWRQPQELTTGVRLLRPRACSAPHDATTARSPPGPTVTI